MTAESDFITTLRSFATAPGARGLMDDAAVLDLGGRTLVLTKDLLVEGVHYLPDDPPGDVAWKLVTVNLSDLAAKGATPVGALLGYMLGEDAWDRAFAEGLRQALGAFATSLLGGDTVAGPAGAPRVLSLTMLGKGGAEVPTRSGARPGDDLWVTGAVGDAGAGLAVLRGEIAGEGALVRAYRRPRPRLEAGQALGPMVHAMMDVSDGLLIDAVRMADASGLAVVVQLEHVPLSDAFIAAFGGDQEARLRAATAGDDYELLFAAPPVSASALHALAAALGLPFSRIGHFAEGGGLSLRGGGGPLPLPGRLGYEHRRARPGA